MFANSLRTNILCFLFLLGNEKQDTMYASVDLLLNMSVYHELLSRHELRVQTRKNKFKLDIFKYSSVAALQSRLVLFQQNF